MWGGAHTGFIGEEPSFGSLTDSSFDRSTEAAADDGLRLEGIAEDHAKCLWNMAETDDQDKKGS